MLSAAFDKIYAHKIPDIWRALSIEMPTVTFEVGELFTP